MKTDRLIDVLSTNLEPVKPGEINRTMAWALVIGTVAALSVMLATVAPRTDIFSDGDLGFFTLKLVFAVSLAGGGAAWLVKSMHPGRETGKPFWLMLLPFVALGVVGAADLLQESSSAWSLALFGTQWAMCVACIPFFAVIPFAILIWAVRKGAPTNLQRTGAIAGLVAGALGAVAYAFHCPDDSLPFIALWYGAAIAFCAFVGGKLGPWLLRW